MSMRSIAGIPVVSELSALKSAPATLPATYIDSLSPVIAITELSYIDSVAHVRGNKNWFFGKHVVEKAS